MFVTDLSDREIVVGKLAARLSPVLALLASALPVVALVGLLGGIEPEAVVWLFLISLAISLVGAEPGARGLGAGGEGARGLDGRRMSSG